MPERYNGDDGDLVHLSPARYAHIKPYGKYRSVQPVRSAQATH